MARKRTMIENQIRRINDAIRRVYNRYGRYTAEVSNITKTIKEELNKVMNVENSYTAEDGLIQISNKTSLRQALSGTSVLDEIELKRPTLTTMRNLYPSRKAAEVTYFLTNKFESLYELLDSSYLTTDQKDILGAILRKDDEGGRIGEINRAHNQDVIMDVVIRAMDDPTLDIAETLEKMGILDYEDTPPPGTGFSYSDNIGMKP